jgi:hypothetical protein
MALEVAITVIGGGSDIFVGTFENNPTLFTIQPDGRLTDSSGVLVAHSFPKSDSPVFFADEDNVSDGGGSICSCSYDTTATAPSELQCTCAGSTRDSSRVFVYGPVWHVNDNVDYPAITPFVQAPTSCPCAP